MLNAVERKHKEQTKPFDIKKIGRAIRCHRLRKGLRQGWVANKIRVSQSWLSALEYGIMKNPSLQRISAVVWCLEITMSDFFLSIENNTYMFKKINNQNKEESE